MALHNSPNGPYVIQANNSNSEVLRQMLESVTGARSGIVNPTDFLVAAHGTPNMSVDVAAGFAVVNGTEAGAQGSYAVYNDATVNVAITAANATNPRIDLVVVAVQDAQYSGANNQALLAVIAGTPAGSPVAPTIPVSPYFNALALAQIAVGANVTSITSGNVTDKRVGRTPAGKIHGATGQSISLNAFTQVTLGTTDYLAGGMTILAGNSLVVPVSGYYAINWSVRLSGYVGTWIRLASQIYVNGVAATLGSDVFATPAGATAVPSSVGGDTLYVGAGQPIALFAYQNNNASAAQNLFADSSNFLTAALIGF